MARLLVLTAVLAGCSSSEDDPNANGTPSGGQGGASTGGVVGKAGAASGDGGSAATSATGGKAGSAGTTPGAGSGSLSGGSGGGSGGAGAGAGGTAGNAGGAGTGGTAGGAGGGQGGSAGGSTAPAVHFVGRVDDSDPANARFAWSGTGVVARFQGTEVSALLGGAQQFTVVVDGAVRVPKLTAQDGTNSLASGLSAGEHTVELYRRTEPSLGVATFMGFDFGGGTALAPPTPTRRLEFVGDSITCGYGNEGADMSCTFSADTENHYLTYAALTARALDAELSTVAWSGKGVVCNYGDTADACQNPFPTYYDRTLPEDSTSKWDFSRFVPHAVVVNLGTNDFSTATDPTKEEFETGYRTFLERIRAVYPDAYILCTNGPMLSGTDLSTLMGYIDDVVTALGDPKISSFDISPQDGSDGYGCDWHPSLARHEKVATAVTAELKAKLGW